MQPKIEEESNSSQSQDGDSQDGATNLTTNSHLYQQGKHIQGFIWAKHKNWFIYVPWYIRRITEKHLTGCFCLL